MLLRFCEWLQNASWIAAINSSIIASVVVELTHYFRFFLLVGTSVMVDLRVLGLAGRRQNVTLLADQLFPLTWTGLGFSVLSGFILFAGDATTFFPNPVFRAKVIVLSLAVVFAAVVQWNVHKRGQAPVIQISSKLVALLSVMLWIGVILAAVEIPHLTYVP